MKSVTKMILLLGAISALVFLSSGAVYALGGGGSHGGMGVQNSCRAGAPLQARVVPLAHRTRLEEEAKAMEASIRQESAS
jgi:hypothetical protein